MLNFRTYTIQRLQEKIGAKASALFSFPNGINFYTRGRIYITLLENLIDGESVQVGSGAYTFRDSPSDTYDVQIGGTLAETLTNLISKINTGDSRSPEVNAIAGAAGKMRLQARTAGSSINGQPFGPSDPSKWYFSDDTFDVPSNTKRFSLVEQLAGYPGGKVYDLTFEIRDDGRTLHIEGPCSTPFLGVIISYRSDIWNDPSQASYNTGPASVDGQISIDIDVDSLGSWFDQRSDYYLIFAGQGSGPSVWYDTQFHLSGYRARTPASSDGQFHNGVDGGDIQMGSVSYKIVNELADRDQEANEFLFTTNEDFAGNFGNVLASGATGGHASAGTIANPDVLETADDDGIEHFEIEARSVGVAGNDIPVSESNTGGSWDGSNLQGGIDGSSQPGESDKREFIATGAILSGYEEMASPEFAAMVEGAYTKTFRVRTDDTNADVGIGDRLIRSDDNDIREVKGVQPHLDLPGRYIEIVVIKSIQQ